MKTLSHILLLGLSLLLLTVADTAQAQDRNPTVYPYGCVPDSSLRKSWMDESQSWRDKNPLRCGGVDFTRAPFDSLADFRSASFDSLANFSGASFDRWADFIQAKFDSLAGFRSASFHSLAQFGFAKFHSLAQFTFAKFDSLADFRSVSFYSLANFYLAKFDSLADFIQAKFDSLADFNEAKFDSLADFIQAKFYSQADFTFAEFYSQVDFNVAEFYSQADFNEAKFDSQANFILAKFYSRADFTRAKINDHIRFLSADLLGSVDFRFARFDRAAVATFHRANLGDSLLLGDSLSSTLPHFDFTRANLLSAGKKKILADTVRHQKAKTITYPGAKIVLFGPVDLKIQLEKFKFIALHESLGYFDKKDIITTLKEESFPGTAQAKERFELDYIFERSTMYQKQTFLYERYPFYHPSAWRDFLYYHLMGLGYRPFKIFIWAIVFVALFAVFYLLKMPDQINAYLEPEQPKRSYLANKPPKRLEARYITNTVINCVYFSCMMFFTFRLKKDVLTFFNYREKRIVVFQWVLGFAVYVAFLTLAKSGSILHTLRSLFVG